ncbi:MAG: ferrous iron transport protein A [Desulfosalsimonadaceae bacterium]
MTLDKLTPGKKGIIKQVRIGGQLGQRLMDMGFIPGFEFEVLRNAPLVDPVELRLDDHMVSLRHSEAGYVEVEQT